MNQYATSVETIQAGPCLTGVMSYRAFSLNKFPRSVDIAYNYKYYRAAEVEWRYTPYYNSFQEDGNQTLPTTPYMYHIMNRTQDSFIPGTKATQTQYMISQGSKPLKYTGIRVIKYKPNWNSAGLTLWNASVLNTVQVGSKVEYGWLPCPDQISGQTSGNTIAQQVVVPIPGNNPIIGSINTATVIYNGHYDFFDQGVASGLSQPSCGVLTCTVKWEFKNPGGVFLVDRDPPVEPAV